MTFAIIGGGPSLTPDDVADVFVCHARGQMYVIGINDAYRCAPWVDALYAADAKWIDAHDGVASFQGQKYSIEGGSQPATTRPDWCVLRNTGFVGLETHPSGLRAGFNSGYQAINLAVHLGATRILLLGYDMGPAPDGRTHWFGDHPEAIRTVSPYDQMRAAFDTLVEPLKALGIEVINCSRRTALTAFPCLPLDRALAERAA